ncbi:glycosyltransferase [Nitrogeniibacter aestuarii]|uniref:glycosyltransferase n=1 Tax=Nitrogeniibacter aestuarii TaxID=2815343 RepID=UPI001D12F867|nr:glycosyltransferase [Nitrogeniibacter aestuarii]
MTERIAIYTPDLSTGGVGKMRTHLMWEMVRRGYEVDLLVARTDSPLFGRIPDAVHVEQIGTTHPFYSLFPLVRYFRSRKPTVLLTDRLRLSKACQRAVSWSRVPTRLYLSMHNPLSVKLDALSEPKRKRLHGDFMQWALKNDRLIAVSDGVAADLVEHIGVPAEFISTVTNPVITPEILQLAAQPLDHPFFGSHHDPVVLAAGRMTEQKDFPTLLRAFERVRRERRVKMVLLGDQAGHFAELEAMVRTLGIEDDVSFPGFEPNPYRYMARADVFALSSRWEGFGNVMVEALATGLPVVATDCPVGPREILQDGALGPLVPMGDSQALANGIMQMLDERPAAERLQAGVAKYTVEHSVDGYLKAFGLDG